MTVIRLPGVSDDDNRTLNTLLDRLDRKTPRNYLRSCYYDMRHAVDLVGSVIPQQYARLGIVLGWAAKAVDILARRCNLDGFVWPDGEIDDLGMATIWGGNQLGSEVSQGLIASLIHAVSFAVVTQGRAGEPPVLIHFRDALNATGEWDTRSRRLTSFVSIGARDELRHPSALTLYLDGRTIDARLDNGIWSTSVQTHGWHVPAFPLPYRPRVGREFGSSRISRAVMSYQDAAARSAIRLEAHSDIYAIPNLWMLGADASIFKNVDGSTVDAVQTVMGRIRGIPDDDEAPSDQLSRADLKQFPAADPEPHLKALKQQAQLFSGETSIPLTSLGVSDTSNPTSADSYIASREDLISEAEGATDDWAPHLRNAIVTALAMANGIGSDDVPASWLSIAPKWRSPIYLSRAQQADAGMKQITAAPWLAETTVGLELLGLSQQQIERAQAEKRRSAGSALLERISANQG